MFYNVKKYLEKRSFRKKNYHFRRVFSLNHIAAAAALGKEFGIETLGIIRGDELKLLARKSYTFFSAPKRNDFQICNPRNL